MGLLDDAIREHLDLKRRRGADPAEVARLEQEALGPVRREPVAEPTAAEPAAPTAEPEPAAAAEHPHPAPEDLLPDEHTHVLAPEDRHEPPHGDPLMGGAAAEQQHDEQELGGASAEPEAEAGDADRAGGAGETISAAPPAESSSPATGPARHEADPELVDQPTTEYRVEDHEDVLEETPEFLQETPEHDRLWFEQRPPRDFDFDG